MMGVNVMMLAQGAIDPMAHAEVPSSVHPCNMYNVVGRNALQAALNPK